MARRNTILVSRTLYQMGIVTLIGSLAWVGISVYNAMVTSPALPVDRGVLAPISPVIDQAVVASLSARPAMQEIVPSASKSGGLK